MNKIQELSGVGCVDSDDLSNASEQLLFAAQQLIEIQNPVINTSVKLTVEQAIKAQLEAMQRHPLLVTGIAVVATLERFRVDYAYQQNHTQLLLQDLIESVDCAGAKAPLANETILTALSQEHTLAALKACWLKLHPQHTEQEYRAAILEFEKLLGL